jgi:hypothetical protein
VVIDTYVYHKIADLIVRILSKVHKGWCHRGNHFTNLKHNSNVS